MEEKCRHTRTKVSLKTGGRPKHVCLLCGKILNSNPDLKKEDVSSSEEKES